MGAREFEEGSDLDRRKRWADSVRCEHTTLPVEVLPVAGGKKIAHCLGCGRSGPARPSGPEALAALRDEPRWYFGATG